MATIINVLTIKQPWAYLFASGAKKIETRSWSTTFRGELFIHASTKASSHDLELCRLEPVFRKFIPDMQVLVTGAIIGKVDIIDCLPISKVCPSEQERRMGDYRPNRFGWVAAEGSAELIRPILCQGKLGIWKFEIEREEVCNG